MHRGTATLLAALVSVTSLAAQQESLTVRFASFNASLNRDSEGELIEDLSSPEDSQARAVAEIIQGLRPDILLINEFDFDAEGTALDLFQQNYLNVSQNGFAPIHYPYVYVASSNTGIPSGFDLDNSGSVVSEPGEFGYGNDSLGFGNFPGQFAMVVLSRYRIVEEGVRSFQGFLWADMPGALLPDDAETAEPGDFYSEEELEVLPLSSKTHLDIPVRIREGVVHVLCAHPTPPVFDGPEDRNGRRNHDEIRFWADYITPGSSDYIYDDEGYYGGLGEGDRFVIMGDYNADPIDGDSVPGAIQQLLEHPGVVDPCPTSLGGLEAAIAQAGVNLAHAGNPTYDTGDFTDASKFFDPSGNLRVDYVLPSANLGIAGSGVAWPTDDQPFFDLVGDGTSFISSDHRAVWADLTAFPNSGADPFTPVGLEFLGEATLPTGELFADTEVGGLSALVYDETVDAYLALSDDRSSIDAARQYTLTIDLSDGLLSSGDVEIRDVITLLQSSGEPFAENGLDPEGLALAKDGALYLSSEGDASDLLDPFVDRFGVAGTQFDPLPVPTKFLVGPGVGVRTNLAFESLTLSPNEERLYTATENALVQDGPAASLTDSTPCRILTYDLTTGQPTEEYIYWAEPVAEPSDPPGEFSTNGLVELLAVDDNRLLAVERSFSVGAGNTIRLFAISIANADDVSAVEALDGIADDFAPVSKFLVLDFDDLGITLDNVEGITFGPELPDGRRTLVLVSDNNFNPSQFTQFLAFAIDE